MSHEPSNGRVGLYATFCVTAAITALLAAALVLPSRDDVGLNRRPLGSPRHAPLDEPRVRP
jgi:hypothetical protein